MSANGRNAIATAILALVVVTTSALAQQPMKTKKPISHYMQEMGLLYLENVDSMLEQARKDNLNESNHKIAAAEAAKRGEESELVPEHKSALDNSYGKALENLEDHIEINITLAADKQYLKLLERTKLAAEQSASITELAGQFKTLGAVLSFGEKYDIYPVCQSQAHYVAKSGLFSDGDCTEAKYWATHKAVQEAEGEAAREQLVEATHRHAMVFHLPEDQLFAGLCARGLLPKDYRVKILPQGEEMTCEKLVQEQTDQNKRRLALRETCGSFANGSAEKVLAKSMPLPPKECREVLGWARDASLDPLYSGKQ